MYKNVMLYHLCLYISAFIEHENFVCFKLLTFIKYQFHMSEVKICCSVYLI